MESVLKEKGVFSFRSVAASIGGVEDRGLGLSAEGRKMLQAAIERNNLPQINAKNYNDSLDQKMVIYREKAGDSPIKVYISIGGGTTSVGTRVGKRLFRPGLNFREPSNLMPIDSVMSRFIDQGIPAIHLVKVEELAGRYGLPTQPFNKVPGVGQGEVFRREEYNYWLTAGVLTMIILCLVAFVRLDWGFRILGSSFLREKSDSHPEPMI
jgi:poly-gamma-glutamate system protein